MRAWIAVATLLAASGCASSWAQPRMLDIFEAAKQGNVARLAEVLAADPGAVNKKDAEYSRTPLHFAAWNGRTEAVKFLLEKGADVKLKDPGGGTPLHFAVSHDHREAAKLILDAGPDINATDWFGPPLVWAASQGTPEMVALLLDRGADANAKSRLGALPIHLALSRGRARIPELLLAKGSDVDVCVAAGLGQTDRVEAFLKEDPKRLESRVDGKTPLLYAATNGRTDTLKYLLEKGADANDDRGDGYTALHCAVVLARSQEATRLLLAHGADPNRVARVGIDGTPLHFAAYVGAVGPAEELLDHGADRDLRDRSGHAPLHIAAPRSLDVVKALVAKGADVNVRDAQGERFRHGAPTALTPLHYAARAGQLETVIFLVDHGAEVNAEDTSGRTALAYALESTAPAVAEYLAKHGGTVGHPKPITAIP